MANDVATTESEEEAAPKKKLSGKTLILFIILPAVLLIGGGVTAFMLLKPKGEVSHEKKEEKGKKEEKKGGHGAAKEGEGGAEDTNGAKVAVGPNGEVFLTIPDILVNITTTDGRPAFLKLRLTLQTKDESTAGAVEAALPRIQDQFTGFLRELRMDDIAGSAGYSRLQLELLKRVNLAVAPAQVDAVLVEEMLVQ